MLNSWFITTIMVIRWKIKQIKIILHVKKGVTWQWGTTNMPQSDSKRAACWMKSWRDECWHPTADNKCRMRQMEEKERRGGKDKKKCSSDVVVWGLIPLRHTQLLLREWREEGGQKEKENDLWRHSTWKRCVNTLMVKSEGMQTQEGMEHTI